VPDPVAELTVFCGSLVGASLGFLWYNSYPAEMFMGDVGSLALGAALGTVAILIKQELLLVIVGGVFVLEGLSQLVWGSQPHGLELGIPDVPMEWLSQSTGVNISQFDVFAAVVAGVMVATLALFFQYTRIGRALRAVADDHQAALAVGIPLKNIWAIVWTVAGFVALVAGLMWGARNGVQYALTFIALKALPVLLIGGFESVPGAILGGLIIGATEKLAEVYIGPLFGGGIESWFAYVVALLFLLVRPEGLFGEKRIERV